MLFGSGKWKEQDELNRRVDTRLKSLDKSLHDSFGNVKQDVEHVKQWIAYLHKTQDSLNNTLSDFGNKFSEMLTRDDLRSFVDEYYRSFNSLNNSVSSIKDEASSAKSAVLNLNSEVSGLKNDFSSQIFALQAGQRSVFQQLEALSKRESSLGREQLTDLRNEFKADISTLRKDIRDEFNSVMQQPREQEIPSVLPPAIFQRLDDLNKRILELQESASQPKVPVKTSLKEKIFRKVTRHSKDYVKNMLISLIKKYDKISGLNLREIVVEEQGIVSKSSFYRLLAEIEEEEGIHVLHEGKEKHYFWTVNNSPRAS